MVKRDSQHGERIKASLLKAAASLFIRVGYEATPVRDIAAQAGLTTGSLYHFFANKEEMLGHLVRDMFATTESMADALTQDSPDPIVCLSFELALQLQLISADERLATLYEAAHASHAISRQILDLARQRFQSLLAAVVPAHELENTAHRLSVTAKSLMMGLVQERIILDQLDLDGRLRLLLQALWCQLPGAVPEVQQLHRRIDELLTRHRQDIAKLSAPAATKSATKDLP